MGERGRRRVRSGVPGRTCGPRTRPLVLRPGCRLRRGTRRSRGAFGWRAKGSRRPTGRMPTRLRLRQVPRARTDRITAPGPVPPTRPAGRCGRRGNATGTGPRPGVSGARAPRRVRVQQGPGRRPGLGQPHRPPLGRVMWPGRRCGGLRGPGRPALRSRGGNTARLSRSEGRARSGRWWSRVCPGRLRGALLTVGRGSELLPRPGTPGSVRGLVPLLGPTRRPGTVTGPAGSRSPVPGPMTEPCPTEPCQVCGPVRGPRPLPAPGREACPALAPVRPRSPVLAPATSPGKPCGPHAMPPSGPGKRRRVLVPGLWARGAGLRGGPRARRRPGCGRDGAMEAMSEQAGRLEFRARGRGMPRVIGPRETFR